MKIFLNTFCKLNSQKGIFVVFSVVIAYISIMESENITISDFFSILIVIANIHYYVSNLIKILAGCLLNN